MIERMNVVSAIVLLLVTASVPVRAQLRTNDTVRATIHSGTTYEGVLSQGTRSALTLIDLSTRDTLALLRADMKALERRVGQHRYGANAVSIAVGVGIIGGWIWGNARRRADEANGPLLLNAFPYEVAGALAGAGAGALVGLPFAFVRVPTWETLSIDATVTP